MQLTEQQVIAIGTDLRKIVEGDSFNTAVKVLEETITNRILTSPVEDVAGRESAYQLHRALGELIATFTSITVLAEQTLAQWELDAIDQE